MPPSGEESKKGSGGSAAGGSEAGGESGRLRTPRPTGESRKESAPAAAQDAAKGAKAKDEPRPPLLKVWLTATRPHTITASLTPVIVGAALARHEGVAHAERRVALFWLFAVCMQIGTNLHNDYADFVRGADTSARVGHARATQKGWLTQQTVRRAADGCIGGGLAIGLWLTAASAIYSGFSPWPMLFAACSSAFNSYAYTGGPSPLSYIGLEKLSYAYLGVADGVCFVYFGLVATCTPYWLQTGTVSVANFCSAVPMGLLATAVLVVNNLRDRVTDEVAGKRTLAVRLGGPFTRGFYASLVLGSYVWLVGCSIVSSSLWWLAPLPSLWVAYGLLRAVCVEEDGAALNARVGGTARLQLLFGVLLAIAALVG